MSSHIYWPYTEHTKRTFFEIVVGNNVLIKTKMFNKLKQASYRYALNLKKKNAFITVLILY